MVARKERGREGKVCGPLPAQADTPATERAVETALVEHDSATLKRFSRFLEPILETMIQKESKPARAQQFYQALNAYLEIAQNQRRNKGSHPLSGLILAPIRFRFVSLPNCPLREFGDCAKIDLPAVAANVPVNASAGGSRFGSENRSQD